MKSLQILHIGFILLCLSSFTLQASECANVFSMQADQLTDKIPQFFKGLGYSPSKQNLFHSVPEFFRSHIKRGESFLILRKGEIIPEKVSFVSFKYPEGEQPILTVKNKKGKLLNLSFQDINSIGHESTYGHLVKETNLLDVVGLAFEGMYSTIGMLYKKKLHMRLKEEPFHKGEDFNIFIPRSFFKNEKKMELVNEIQQAVEKFKLELKNSEFLHTKGRSNRLIIWPVSHIVISNNPTSSIAYTLPLGYKNRKEEHIVVLNLNRINSRIVKRITGDIGIVSTVLHEISHNYINSLSFQMINFPEFNTVEEALADYMPYLYTGYQPMEGRNFKNLNVAVFGNRTIEGFDLLSPNIPRSKENLNYHKHSIFISHFLYQMEQILGRETMKSIFRDFVQNLIEHSHKLEDFVGAERVIQTDRKLYKPIIEVFYALAVFSRTLDKDTTHDSQKIKQAQKFLTQFKEEFGNHPFVSDVLSF